MFLITIILKSTPQLLQFHFNEHQAAVAYIKKYDITGDDRYDTTGNEDGDEHLNIDDSFGSTARIRMKEIAGIFLTDLDREMDAAAEVDMARNRKDIKVQKQAQQDVQGTILTPSAIRQN